MVAAVFCCVWVGIVWAMAVAPEHDDDDDTNSNHDATTID